jgi:hypothetical protein
LAQKEFGWEFGTISPTGDSDPFVVNCAAESVMLANAAYPRWREMDVVGPGTTDIASAPVRAKFVRITQTAAEPDAPLWSIQRLKVNEAGR